MMVIGGTPVVDAGPDYEDSTHAREWYVGRLLGEVGKDDPAPYWLKCGWKRPFPKNWCGAFALWGLHDAGLCDWDWEFDPAKKHYGFLYRLKQTTRPQTGDIAYFAKHQHHAVFDGLTQLINGNGSGGRVTVTPSKQPTAWYSIGQLVAKFDLQDLPEET